MSFPLNSSVYTVLYSDSQRAYSLAVEYTRPGIWIAERLSINESVKSALNMIFSVLMTYIGSSQRDRNLTEL